MKLEVLKIRDFRVTLLTRFLVMFSWLAQDVIIGWQVYSITKDPLMLGLTGLVEAVPALICALFAGHFVDVNRPYIVYLGCICLMAFNSFILLLMGGEFIHAPGGLLHWLFIGVFISGLARSFIMPASFALLPQIISRDKMPSAAAFLTSSFQLATIIGPVVAGLVYGGYGHRVAWFIPFTLVSMAVIMHLTGISEAPRKWRSSEKREKAAKSIKAGWKFILGNKTLLSVMALDMFAVLFGGAVAMLPAYADQVLHTDAEGLGILRAAPAIGAVLTALILAVRPFKTISAKWLLWVITGFGFCTIGFGLSNIFWLSLIFLAIGGAFDSVSMVLRGTLMQWLIPDNMRGRVSSVNSMFIISSNQIGAFQQGAMAKIFGLVPSIVIGGTCTVMIAAGVAAISPKLRKLVVKHE